MSVRIRKLYERKFYLSPDDEAELILKLELGSITRYVDAVAFVDEKGEWLE